MEDATSSTSSATPISLWRLALSTLGPCLLVLLSYYFRLGLERKLLIGLIRSFTQLLFLGSVLLHYIFSFESPLLVLLYLLFMISIASLEAVGGGLVTLFGTLVVFHPHPWWKPQVLIPTAGMIIGNAISSPSVAVERVLSEAKEKQHEIEIRLSFGATAYESILPMVAIALQAALMPMLNQLAIMGLVSIPGMMTGQILGGTPPIVAAEYQLAILYLIIQTTMISSAVSIYLVTRNAIFHLSSHQLTPDRITLKADGKQDLDTVISKSIYNLFSRYSQSFYLCWSTTNQYEVLPTTSDTTSTDESTTIASKSRLVTSSVDNDSTRRATAMITNNSNNNPGSNNQETLKKDVNRQSSPAILIIDQINIKSGNFLLFSSEQETESIIFSQDIELGKTTNSKHNHNSNSSSYTSNVPREEEYHENNFLSIVIRRGERISLEGPSGLGKTRLLKAISKLEQPFHGSLSYLGAIGSGDGIDYNFSFPHWRTKALPPMTGSPSSFLLECLKYHSRRTWKIVQENTEDQLQAIIQRYCDYFTERLLLRNHLLEERWNTLSGGERQRAAIACGFILAALGSYSSSTSTASSLEEGKNGVNISCEDTVILLDEPTAACDAQSSLAVEAIIVESKITCIFITHDERQALRLAHRRIQLIVTDTSSSSTSPLE